MQASQQQSRRHILIRAKVNRELFLIQRIHLLSNTNNSRKNRIALLLKRNNNRRIRVPIKILQINKMWLQMTILELQMQIRLWGLVRDRDLLLLQLLSKVQAFYSKRVKEQSHHLNSQCLSKSNLLLTSCLQQIGRCIRSNSNKML